MKTGIPLALASAVLFGASTPFAKLLLGTVDPWLMAGLLYIGAGLGLAIIHLSRGVLRLPAIEAPLRRPDLPWLAAVILFGGVLATDCGFWSHLMAACRMLALQYENGLRKPG